MEKLTMCRICLAQNTRMYVVVNKNLRELYEKLTDVPFVTEDRRPILACFFCCVKLKQCFGLMQKCLEAEKLFAQMTNEDYEPNPSINPEHLGLCRGFIISPIQHISIVEKGQTQSIIAIKEESPEVEGVDDIQGNLSNECINLTEELPHVLDRLHDIIENQSDDLKLEDTGNSYLDVEDMHLQHSESDPGDDVPLKEVSIKVEEALEVPKKKHKAVETTNLKLEDTGNSYLDVEDMHLQHSESDPGDDVPLKEVSIKVEEALEVPKKKHKAVETTNLKLEDTGNSYLDVEDMHLQHSESDPGDDVPLKEVSIKVEEALEVPKKKHKAVETTNLKLEDTGNSYLDVEDMHLQHSESDPGDDVPLKEVSIKVEEALEVPKKKHKAVETTNLKLEDTGNSYLDVEDMHLQHSESDPGDDVPLKEVSIKVEEALEVPKKKHKAVETTRTPVTRKRKLEDTTTAEQKKNEPSKLKDFRTTQNRTSKHGSSYEEPDECDQLSLNEVKTLKQHTRTRMSKRRYECDICQRNFSYKGVLTNHIIRKHTGVKPYKCDVCQCSFNEKGNFTKHIRIHTGEKPYNCDVCQLSFKEKGTLTRHIRIHTGEKPYKCNICQRSFNEKGYLTKHVRIHTGVKPYKCDVCQLSFNEKGNLIKHVRIHTGVKPYKCDVCQLSFKKKGTLTQHIRIHTGEKPYKCNICQLSFKVNWTLKKHLRIHTGEKPYKCDVCQLSFNQKGTLTKHIRIHTGDKPYKCDVCQCSFRQKYHLTKHIRIHTGEKPYKCNICQLSFIEKGTFTKHIRKHTGEKPYKCDACQLSFYEKSHLTKHIRIHTGEKPYKCDVCQLSFNEKGTLKKHIRIHTGDKPYKCDVCQLSFNQKGTLTKHIRIHTGDKPYKCDVCQCSFRQKYHLTKHIRIHTGEKPYKCNICQLSFIEKGTLTIHIRIHTAEKPY